MSQAHITSCEVVREFLFIAYQSRAKAKTHPSLATEFWQVSLEMQRAINRHADHCEKCLEQERLAGPKVFHA